MMGRTLKRGLLLILAGTLAGAGYLGYVYREVRAYAALDEAHLADAIVVLGAAQYNGRPSPVFKARLDHAFALFEKGLARSIITTGGFGPDPNFSEAHVGTQYLVQLGVDPAIIVTEQGSGTTGESILAISRLMQAKGWTSALVVSDGFHLFRIKRMFADSGILAYTSPSPNSPIEMASSQRFFYSLREVLLFAAYRIAT